MVQRGCQITVFYCKAQLLSSSNFIFNGDAELSTASPNRIAMVMHLEGVSGSSLPREDSIMFTDGPGLSSCSHNIFTRTPYFEKEPAGEYGFLAWPQRLTDKVAH